jgi:hypothetical protein
MIVLKSAELLHSKLLVPPAIFRSAAPHTFVSPERTNGFLHDDVDLNIYILFAAKLILKQTQ